MKSSISRFPLTRRLEAKLENGSSGWIRAESTERSEVIEA